MSVSKPHIETLLAKFSAGTASKSDVDELFTLLNEPGTDEMVVALIAAQLENVEAGEEDMAYWQERLKTMPELITKQAIINTGRVVKLRKWYWAAAIIFVILSSSLIFIISRHSTPGERPAIVKNDNGQEIKPGTNKAILKLADGSEIVLDSSSTGSIAKQGNTIITSSSNGSVEYSHDENAPSIQFNTMITPKGGQYHLTLSDGTQVWMNAGSSITYPVAFIGKQRKVSVTGEVYFEVNKNPGKPFIVDINDGASVEVTGTHFNINAYSNEEATKVTLFEGGVNVSASESKSSNRLIPGQQASVISKSSIRIRSDVDLDKVIAWKNGLFNFNDTELKEVMRQLERWYAIDVTYEGQVPTVIFDGKMDRALTLSQVLKILTKSEIIYKVEGRKLIIGRK